MLSRCLHCERSCIGKFCSEGHRVRYWDWVLAEVVRIKDDPSIPDEQKPDAVRALFVRKETPR